MILHIDRGRMAVVVRELERRVADRLERYRRMGRSMKLAGGGVEHAAFIVGSYAWTAWVEGWSGTEAPRRDVVNGRFDMTPAQEMEARMAWLRAVGVAEHDIARAMAVFRTGYRPEALGSVQ